MRVVLLAVNKAVLLRQNLLEKILPFATSSVSTVLFKFLGTLRMAVDHQSIIYLRCSYTSGGTAAAAPLPFRLGNPVLCGSRPLVTPYYC